MLNIRICTVFMLVSFFCYRTAFGYRIVPVDFTKEQPSDDTNWKNVELVAPSKYWTLHDFVNQLRADDADIGSPPLHSGHYHRNLGNTASDGHRLKRSIGAGRQNNAEPSLASLLAPEMLDLSNEIFTEQLLNAPISQLDMELIEQTPWLKKLLIRLMYFVQEKRNRDFNPRLGRRSADDCAEYPRQNYAPRLGKKDMPFTPRLGRDSSSG